MCVNIDRLTVYKYLLAEDSRKGSLRYAGSSKMPNLAVRAFCSALQREIVAHADVSPCYEYISFSGFDEPSREVLSEDGKRLFARSRNAVIVLDKSAIQDAAEAIENHYRKAYRNDVVPTAFRVAREEALCVAKAVMEEESSARAARAQHAAAIAQKAAKTRQTRRARARVAAVV